MPALSLSWTCVRPNLLSCARRSSLAQGMSKSGAGHEQVWRRTFLYPAQGTNRWIAGLVLCRGHGVNGAPSCKKPKNILHYLHSGLNMQ